MSNVKVFPIRRANGREGKLTISEICPSGDWYLSYTSDWPGEPQELGTIPHEDIKDYIERMFGIDLELGC